MDLRDLIRNFTPKVVGSGCKSALNNIDFEILAQVVIYTI